MASALANRCSVSDQLETNLGISNKLRLRIPASKCDLVFGRPEHLTAERATLDLVRILARDADAFLDVGANEGLYTFTVAATAKGPSIHAFEADVEICARLGANIIRNNISASLHNVAVSDRLGTQTFFRNLTDDSSGSLTDFFRQKHETVAVEVKTTTLTHYLKHQDIRRGCIKVDVEGAGHAVWFGLRDEIDRVGCLVIETIGPESKGGLVAQIISEAGLHAYYIRDYELVHSPTGERDYIAPFLNWLLCRLSPDELKGTLHGSAFSIVRR